MGPLTISFLYASVDLAGTNAWNENARLKVLGEKRILSQFPDDPRISWNEWKRDPAHFE